MKYSNWILSIYDEYEKKYNEGKEENKKNFIQEIRTLDIKTKLKLIFGIVPLGIYFYGIVYINLKALIGGILLLIMYTSVIIYIEQSPLKYYKKSIIILNEILKKEGLDNIKSIEQLIIATDKGFLVKKMIEFIFFKSVGLLTVSLGIVYRLRKIIYNKCIRILLLLIITILVWVGITYWIFMIMPKGKMARRKQFNQLLKILLFYKQNSTKDIEDMKGVEENKEIIIKEIIIKEIDLK